MLNIKAVEDTVALCLTWENFEMLSKQNMDFVLLFYNVLMNFVIEYEERDFRMRSNSLSLAQAEELGCFLEWTGLFHRRPILALK